jgi:hypothetical protein
MNLTPTPKPHRQHRLSRPILASTAASVILGATFAACACAWTSPAEGHNRRGHNRRGHGCRATDERWPLVLGP